MVSRVLCEALATSMQYELGNQRDNARHYLGYIQPVAKIFLRINRVESNDLMLDWLGNTMGIILGIGIWM